MSRLLSISYRLFGEPQPKGAPRSQLLRWIRRFYTRIMPLTILAWVAVIIWAPGTWVLVVGAVSALIWLQGFTSLSLRIRREEARERRAGALPG